MWQVITLSYTMSEITMITLSLHHVHQVISLSIYTKILPWSHYSVLYQVITLSYTKSLLCLYTKVITLSVYQSHNSVLISKSLLCLDTKSLLCLYKGYSKSLRVHILTYYSVIMPSHILSTYQLITLSVY